MCKKRKLSVMILSVCIFATTSIFSTIVYGSSEDESKIIEKAKTVFHSNRDMFNLTEEEFLKEIENRKPNEVLFASSLAKSFNKDIQYIYDLLDAKKTEDEILNILNSESDKELQKERVKSNEMENELQNIENLPFEERIALKKKYGLIKEEIEEKESDSLEERLRHIQNLPFEEAVALKEEFYTKKGWLTEKSIKEKKFDPLVEKMRHIDELSFEEADALIEELKKQNAHKEKEHKIIYLYFQSIVNEDNNTIQHVYRRCCANSICSGYTDKFFLTKPYSLDKSILTEEDNVGINTYRLSEGVEFKVQEIEIEREYILE